MHKIVIHAVSLNIVLAALNQMQSQTFLWLYNISKHQDVSRIEQ